jgi:uncharacterized membrane protein YkvA (DUF1232 family)
MNIASWKQRARDLRIEVYALSLALHDPRVPWYAKLCAGGVIAYALSPIDLIPDFIPVLGFLDDLIVVPLGVALVRRMVPAAVLAEHREAASTHFASARPKSLLGAGIVVAVWALTCALVARLVLR